MSHWRQQSTDCFHLDVNLGTYLATAFEWLDREREAGDEE